ncbi:MAG: hypothetical protein JO362_16380 [Streptomycetaceae bacterium]|nr:hypothetical protein [Streptomycetaceae bacterium]
MLRVGAGERAGDLWVVGADGAPQNNWQVAPLGDGLVAVTPGTTRPMPAITLDLATGLQLQAGGTLAPVGRMPDGCRRTHADLAVPQ